MKSCFAYIRVSTVRQGEQGVSLAEQRDAIVAYAQKHNLDIAEWFEETVTAAKRGRPQFSAMLSRLHQKEADGVVMHKIDRSARNLRDWADLADLIDAGIEFHFAADGLNLNTRSGRLSADIQAVVAADYIRNLSEEARKGFYGRLKQGIYPLRAPTGYLNNGGGKVKTPDPDRAPIIARAFKLYATGEYTLRTLREALPLTSRDGKPVSIVGWSKILNNPFYYGLIKLRKTGEIFEGVHTPIISRELFEEVQTVLAGKAGRKKYKHDFAFKRMFECGLCGTAMIGERQKGNVYYRCHTRTCETKGVREEILSESVTDVLGRCSLHPQVAPVAFKRLEEKIKTSATDYSDRMKGLELNLHKLKEREGRLTGAYLDGLISEETFRENKAKDALSKQKIERDIDGLRHNNGARLSMVQKNLELASCLSHTYFHADQPEKRRLLKMTTSNRSVNIKNVEVEPSMPWMAIRSAQAPLYCAHQRRVTRTELGQIAEKILHSLMSEDEYFDEA